MCEIVDSIYLTKDSDRWPAFEYTVMTCQEARKCLTNWATVSFSPMTVLFNLLIAEGSAEVRGFLFL
jgi:hypothetical protein